LRLIKPGQDIEIEVDELPVALKPSPNEAALAMLRDVAEMTKNMPDTDPSQTKSSVKGSAWRAMYG